MELIFKALVFFVSLLLIFVIIKGLSMALDWFIEWFSSDE